MLKTIFQIVFICCIPMLSGKENVGQEYVSYMENYIEWEDFERLKYSYIPTDREITDTETLLEVQKELAQPSNLPYRIYMENSDLDISTLIDELAECWQQNRRKNQYALSVAYKGEDEKGEETMTPFLSLMEEKCAAKVEKELAGRGGFPEYVRLERVRGLDVYTVCVNISVPRRVEREYIVILNGIWEEQEVSWQTVTFPEIAGYERFLPFHSYFTAPLDINYDGCTDLFIYEGHSSGSGGSWGHYKGIIWKEDSGEFIWYDSFPEAVSSAEYLEQRMIEYYRLGAPEECVIEYKVVDGEYTATRELAWITDTFSHNEAGNYISTLFYYEMGVLVREHDVTDMTSEEIYALYPDLDYWRKG